MRFYKEFISALKNRDYSEHQLSTLKRTLALKHKLNKIPTNIEILLHCQKRDFTDLKRKLLTKPVRTLSGVAPVAIMTKPFPCPHGKCIMCPGGVNSAFGDMPQSYTGTEPATMRGIRNNFDPYLQVFNRLEQYILLSQNCEKVELIVMGGTFPSFPPKYQEEFILYAFKAMNDFSELFYDQKGNFKFLFFKKFFQLPAENIDDEKRRKEVQKKVSLIKSRIQTGLNQEQNKNETAKIRCVALCIETRPDYGQLKEGVEMLRLGCTRVELGIQSVYDEILTRIERGHSVQDTKDSLRFLRDLGFKVAGHYMPGLPDSKKRIDYQKDLAGMKKLFSDPDYRPDMLKIYPCMVTRGTKLYQEYRTGKFNPLTAEEAARLIADFKYSVPEYCRIMRIQRDIPTNQIAAGVEMTNLRQYLTQKYPVICRCIRCREPKNGKINWKAVKIKVLEYSASKGKEFFISAVEMRKDWLIGFVRMRFPSQCLRPEITVQSALIRELHVYGTATGIGEEGWVQHQGWGKKLLKTAERIGKKNGRKKMVVISGVGVREYYRKLGYCLEGPYMVKRL